MSGPNGDPNISIDDSIINDEDEFGEEGNEKACLLVVLSSVSSVMLFKLKGNIHQIIVLFLWFLDSKVRISKIRLLLPSS